MSSFEFKIDIDEKEYVDYLRDHPLCSLLQTPSWGNVKKGSGKHLCGIYKDGVLSGCALLLVKEMRFSQRIIYSPRGFIIDYNDRELLSEFCKGVKKFAAQTGAYAVKIDPNVLRRKLSHDGAVKSEEQDQVIESLKAEGFIHAGFGVNVNDYLQPRFQMCVALCDAQKKPLSDEELLKSYDKKARKFIGRYIEERGYTFEKYEDDRLISEFSRLVDITAKRQKITLRDESYFRSIYDAFSPKGDITFYFAKLNLSKLLDFTKGELENKKLQASERDRLEFEAILIDEYTAKLGDAVYTAALMVLRGPKNRSGRGAVAELLYSGSDESFFPRFRPTIELRYFAMKDCRDKGCDYFDLGGIKGTLDGGLASFKKKFNPEIHEYIGEFNLILKPFIYNFFENKIPALRKKYRKIMRKIKQLAEKRH